MKKIICLAPILCCLVFSFCSDRERLNPLDPLNRQSHGLPSDLILSSDKHVIFVSWKKIYNRSITGFNLWRARSDPENLLLITTASAEMTNISDTLSFFYYDTTFFYQISAITDSWESLKSNPQSIIPGPFNYWIADYYRGSLSRISYDGGHILSQSNLYSPNAIDIDPLQEVLWLALAYPARFERLNLAGESQLVQELSSNPIDIAVNIKTSDVFIARENTSELLQFNFNGELINPIPCLFTISQNSQIALDSFRKTVWVIFPDLASIVKINLENPEEKVIFSDIRLSKTISIMPSTGFAWIATDSGVVVIDEKNSLHYLLSQHTILDLDINDEEREIWTVLYDNIEHRPAIQVIEYGIDGWETNEFNIEPVGFFSKIKVNPGSEKTGVLLYDNQENRIIRLDREGNVMGTLSGFSSKLDISIEQ